MFNKNKIKFLDLIEVFLILFFIILVIGILFFIGSRLNTNYIIYNTLIVCSILLTTIVASIAVFQYVKTKYIQELKYVIMEDLDKYKDKIESKVFETNHRIFGFEKNYSKKIKKIMMDYNVKSKEIINLKKEMDIKLCELDRRAAMLEIELCSLRAENIKSEVGNYISEKAALYARIIELNHIYEGISTDDFLALINLKLSEL